MEHRFIETSIGKVAIHLKIVDGTMPIVFLHGVYFDHHLWDYFLQNIADSTIIAIDMPMHGLSKDVIKSWSMDDCANMLLEIIRALNYDKVIAVGHSWGSMTILYAAAKNINKFAAIGLCNMPFKGATQMTKIQFFFQHLLMPFRRFYTKQVAKAIYEKSNLEQNTGLLLHLGKSMEKLTNQEIKTTDRAVIINAINTEEYLEKIKDKAVALKGKEDYVPEPKQLKTTLVEGGHVSPIEAPDEVFQFIKSVIANAK